MGGKPDVKFGEWIQKGFDLYKANLDIMLLCGLIAVVLSLFSAGILAGPMMAGMALIGLRLKDGAEPKPQVGDIFKGFDYFIQSFLLSLVWGVIGLLVFVILNLIPCIGQLLAPLFSLALSTALLFAIFLIVDRKMDFWTASMTSFNKVKQNFLPFAGLCLIVSIIGGLGAILCGIGVFLTYPIYFCIVSAAYRDVFAESTDTLGETTMEQPQGVDTPPVPLADSSVSDETAVDDTPRPPAV